MLPGSEVLAQRGHDSGTLLVVLEGALEAIVQPCRTLASQQLDGGSVGAVHSGKRTAALLVANRHDPLLLLGVLLAQLDHALEQLDRSVGNNRSRKRGALLLVLLVYLFDRSLGWDLLDARGHRIPRLEVAEHAQRHVVRRAHSESLEGGGGTAEADEAGEVAVLAGSGELAQKAQDNGALAAQDGAVQGSAALLAFGEQGGGVVTDQELDDDGIGVVMGSVVQRKAEFTAGDVQDVLLLQLA